jgi:hypothetical protein
MRYNEPKTYFFGNGLAWSRLRQKVDLVGPDSVIPKPVTFFLKRRRALMALQLGVFQWLLHYTAHVS